MSNNALDLLKKALYNGLLIPVIYGICMSIIAQQHQLLTDWDGVMHYFSGLDIYHGNGYRGWASHFWPPLYPLLTGTLSQWMYGMAAAKLISVLSASLLLLVAHRYVYKLSANNILACLAQLLIATNFTFVLLSIKAENHMLDSLFFVLAIYLLWQSLEKGNPPRYFLAGVVCGLAGLSRYTSYSLMPAFVLTLFFFYPPRLAITHALRLAGGFVLISIPWWTINYLNNGSPLATWQYMNVGAGVFTDRTNKWWWWWSGIDSFQSIADIILYDPRAYLYNFCRNVAKSLMLLGYKGQLVGFISGIAALIYAGRQYLKQRVAPWRSPAFLLPLICLLCFVALVSQAFVFSEVFLSWLVLIVIYGVFAIYRLLTDMQLATMRYRPLMLSLVLLITGMDIFYTKRQLDKYVDSSFGLEENTEVTAALKKYDKNLGRKVIMGFHPGRAYYLGSGYIMLPPYYNGDLNGLITYQDMSLKVKEHAPRFPSTIDINDLRVDYLIYDPRAAAFLPQYSFLLDRHSNRIPANFERVYLSDKVAVYRIHQSSPRLTTN